MQGIDPRRIAALAFAALALTSTALAAQHFVRYVRDVHARWAPLDDRQRDQAIERTQNTSVEQWDFIERHVHKGDRYVFLTPVGPRRAFATQRLVFRSYADYWLLPAVAVSNERKATVTIYFDERAPASALCSDAGRTACVLRRR